MAQYGALDLSPIKPTSMHSPDPRGRQQSLESIRKELAQHERIAWMHNLPAPPFNFGAPIGIPSDINQMRINTLLRPSASLPALPQRLPPMAPHQPASSKRHEARNQQQLPDHPSVSDTEPVAKPSVGYGTARAPAAMHKSGSLRRMEEREQAWLQQIADCEAGTGPNPIDLYCMRKHGRRFMPGGLASQTPHLTGNFAPIAVANVRVCKLINGQPFVRGYFANGA